jgi:hypothetical protein
MRSATPECRIQKTASGNRAGPDNSYYYMGLPKMANASLKIIVQTAQIPQFSGISGLRTPLR